MRGPLWLQRLRNQMTWLRAKQELILWLANGEPYVLNTSVQLPAQNITVGDVTFMGRPVGAPFLRVGEVDPNVRAAIVLSSKGSLNGR